jgi:hypothetical protein
MGKGREPCKEPKCASIRQRGGFCARNTRGSISSSIGVPTNYTTRTRRSTGAHASSRNKKHRVGRRQSKETFSREKCDTFQGQGKGKHQVPILTKSSRRLIRRLKTQNTKGGCKEYHSANKSRQCTICMEGRKL